MRTFTRAQSANRQTLVALGSGLFGLLVAGLMFAQALSAPPQTQSMIIPGAVAAVAVGSFFSLLFGYGLARSPTRITLDESGLSLEGLLSRTRLAWAQVAELQRQKMQENARKPMIDVLVLRDEKGKTLARIPGTFDDFAALVAEVETRSGAARGAPTYDREKEIARRLQGQKREQRIMRRLAIGFILAGGYLGWTSADTLIHERALERHGVVGQARVVRKFLFNVTPRLEYTFTDSAGATFTRDVAMDPAAWHALGEAERVPIVYLPANANWSHLVRGEVDLGGPPIQTLFVAMLGLAMAGAILTFIAKGYCGIESRNGKLRLVKLGQVDDALEAGPVTAARLR